jgi:hypothetical protein
LPPIVLESNIFATTANIIVESIGDGNMQYNKQIYKLQYKKDYEKEWHKYIETIDYPAILIEKKDNIESIDFRFAYGLTIFVRGDNADRLLSVYEKITKCLPERVLLMFQMTNDEIQILDNKGLLSGTITAK